MTRATVTMFEAAVDGCLSHRSEPSLVRCLSNSHPPRGGQGWFKDHQEPQGVHPATSTPLRLRSASTIGIGLVGGRSPAEPQLLVL